MFSMQFITNFTIKTLFWEAEIFFKMYCSQNAGNAIWETQILKISLGGHAPRAPQPTCVCGTRLTQSAIAYYPGGRARKMGPLPVLPHHWRILKKCTVTKTWSSIVLWSIFFVSFDFAIQSHRDIYRRSIAQLWHDPTTTQQNNELETSNKAKNCQ